MHTDARTTGPRRVVLHVGLPGTGSAFLHACLRHHREALREAGIRFPAGKDRMLLAALEINRTYAAHGLTSADVEGSWDELARRARRHTAPTGRRTRAAAPGERSVVVIGHELLAAATPRQVARAMTMLKGLEVHLVVEVQDPDRQAADLAGVLSRWGSGLPAARVQVLVDPGPVGRDGAPADPVAAETLWHRFGDLVGFEARLLEPAPSVGGPPGSPVGGPVGGRPERELAGATTD